MIYAMIKWLKIQIGDFIMAIKKVQLNYRSSVSHTVPVRTIPVSNSRIEELNKSIKQKIRQNESERVASLEAVGRYTVR